DRQLRNRARRGGLHGQRADLVPRGRRCAARDPRRRRSADAGPRLPDPARDPRQVLLEERQVAARDRALLDRPPRLLGEVRLPQRRRPLARAALRLLAQITRPGDRARGGAADTSVTSLPPPLEGPPPRG